MSSFAKLTAVVWIAVLATGCAAPQWATVPTSPAQIAATPVAPNSEQIALAQAELQALAAADPLAHDQLLARLRQCDPALWSLAIEQFRAEREYRRRALARGAGPEIVRRLPPTLEATPVSFTSPADEEWRDRLDAAIRALEAATAFEPATEADRARHARLRLLYAVAGRREDAARPIPNAAPAVQAFVSKESEGLCTWLDAERVDDPARRAAEAKPALDEALAALGETAPLLVRHMAFCSEVFSFGVIKRIEKNEFFQGQEVLLYAELENFTSEPTAQGFLTSLRSGYQILDELGTVVAQRDFTATQELCRAIRRDFFIAYRIRLPQPIKPGKYSLRLVVEDARSQKPGQGSIDFLVKEGNAPTA